MRFWHQRYKLEEYRFRYSLGEHLHFSRKAVLNRLGELKPAS